MFNFDFQLISVSYKRKLSATKCVFFMCENFWDPMLTMVNYYLFIPRWLI